MHGLTPAAPTLSNSGGFYDVLWSTPKHSSLQHKACKADDTQHDKLAWYEMHFDHC